MKVEEVLDLYSQSSQVSEIEKFLSQNDDTKVHLKGLVGSMPAFIACAYIKKHIGNHVFILEDKEAASYFYSDLDQILHDTEIHFLPDSFNKPGNFSKMDTANIQARTQALRHFMEEDDSSGVLVTYPEALLELVVDYKDLKKSMISLKVKEEIDLDTFIDILILNGFERTDFVYEPGQFSIRGGIIDLFSFGNDLPYRIELFDKEIESIRVFDPVTQLSEKRISKLNIVPNAQTATSSEMRREFFELIPDKTLFWTSDLNIIKDGLYGYANSLTSLDEIPSEVFGTESLEYTKPARLFHFLEKQKVIEFRNAYFTSHHKIISSAVPQPSTGKDFNILIQKLQENTKAGLRNIIWVDNEKQIDRYYAIFEDLQKEVEFTPILHSIHQGYIDHDLKLACFTDHQIFGRFHKYRIKKAYSRSQAINLQALRELKPGDYVTHIDHGVGKYSGLEKITVKGKLQEAVRILYRDNDILYVGINSLHKISKFAGKDATPPKVNKLGSDTWAKVKRKTKTKIKDIARDLIKLYAERKAKKGYRFSPDTYLQTELEASFFYEDTPDQYKSTQDVKADMESDNPMDRLICGDVGFGKTEIAIRAAFKAITDGKQVAILVPTTILAMQHFNTFKERLSEFPANVDYISRFKTAADKKVTLEKLSKGEIDILIGTHAIVGKQVKFKDLGLLIIDEEQKFGVGVKEKLRAMKGNVDTLTLTATPIPRTLQFSLMGARDLSIINTAPPNRQPIQTELCVVNDEVVKEAIYYEYYRGGQIYFIHNRVKDIEEVADMVRRLCPEVSIGVAHGQMDGPKLEKQMLGFIERKFDCLIATNIIEAGLDIPNANTIIINNAHWFGLSDLHQLRGRVGRSNKKAFCYLFAPPLSGLSRESRERLNTIEQYADLGSGFNIAMRDLDIRGAGNLLGGEQSGFISDIGFDAYHKILDETIEELKETEFKDLFQDGKKAEIREYSKDCTVETDLEMLIPDAYISNISERLRLYSEINLFKTEENLQEFKERMIDRFGPLPAAVEELFNAVRLQWSAKILGMEKVSIKGGKMICLFVSNPDDKFFNSTVFATVLTFVQRNGHLCRFKESPKSLSLIFTQVESMQQAQNLLENILKETKVKEESTSLK